MAFVAECIKGDTLVLTRGWAPRHLGRHQRVRPWQGARRRGPLVVAVLASSLGGIIGIRSWPPWRPMPTLAGRPREVTHTLVFGLALIDEQASVALPTPMQSVT